MGRLAKVAREVITALAGRARAARQDGTVWEVLSIACIVYGVWQVYPPAAWVLGGLIGLAITVALGSEATSGSGPQDS